jgi:hypothetical protein
MAKSMASEDTGGSMDAATEVVKEDTVDANVDSRSSWLNLDIRRIDHGQFRRSKHRRPWHEFHPKGGGAERSGLRSFDRGAVNAGK